MKTNRPPITSPPPLRTHFQTHCAAARCLPAPRRKGLPEAGWEAGPRRLLTASAALLLASGALAQVTLTDIGATAPTPGSNDISQLSNLGFANPPSLNYYWDNGANNPTTSGYVGQTFTTGSNPQGYTLTSVALKTAGNGGNTPTQTQSFTLNIYSLSGAGLTNATLLNTFSATSALLAEGDWMQWTGLGVSLAPGANYAYTFGRSPGSPGDWELMSTATNLPYAGGQVCEIINAGGKVRYSATPNYYDATFDLGLTLPAAPIANPPLESPSYAHLALLAGMNVTLGATAAGSLPIAFTWYTDGGSGGSLTNIPGATGTNLVVNTTGWAPGVYSYDFVASNSFGTSTSSVATITIVTVFMEDIGSSAPTPGPLDITQLLNTSQADDGFNYYTDNGANNNEWNGQAFTTGTNQSGYVLNSLAWKSAGNGNSFPTIQLYDLYIYSLSAGGSNATLVASYQGYGGGAENDWFKWVGLSVALAPNALYAYAFGRDNTATGWEHIGDQGGSPYSGGQLCQIPAAGGTVLYGNSGTSSATFDIGLGISQRAFANAPTYTPNVTPIYAGTLVTLLESAIGASPLYYQWLTDGGGGGTLTNVPGASGANLAVNTTAFAPGTYNYQVIVTNAYGASTSGVVALTVVAASGPIIVTDTTPTNANEGYVGQTVAFSATFTGTLPISYQWNVGGTPIPAASNPSAISNTLVLANLQLSNAGVYTLSAVNSVGGPTNSSPSTLTVLPDPPPPASGTYAAMVLSNGPVVYWRFNETNDPSTGILPTYDASGHNYDGRYGQGSQDGFDSIQGPQPPAFPGFETNNTALGTLLNNSLSFVTVPPINLDTNTVTITMWINPSSAQATFEGLLMNRNGGDGAGFGFGGNANGSGMAELGYTWNTNNAATWGFHSGLYPLAGQWSFVALVVQPTQAAIYLFYIDPVTLQPDLYSAVNPIPHGPEAFSGGTTLVGGDSAGLVGRTFGGSIDEVAVFNSAFTSDQLVALFSKGAGLSVVAASIAGQPQSAGVYSGATVHFTATGINGSPPLTYQWQFNSNNLSNGGNISGATTPSLTISNAAATNEGSYQLLVMNPAGTTPSSNATLTVVTPVPLSYESAVLAYGPLVFWKLNETNNNPASGGVVAYDYVHGVNGVYQIGAQNGFNGILGPEAPVFPGFPANNTAMETFANAANSYMAASAGSLVASNLTYVMWINPPTNVPLDAALLIDRGGAGEGFAFGNSSSASGMAELGYVWNQNNSDTWGWDSFIFPPTNQWSLVAMVIQPTQGAVYLINAEGFQGATNAIPHDTETFGVAWHLGDDAQTANGGRTFPGIISSASVYLSALSPEQLITLYQAGAEVTLNIARSSPGHLTLSWSQGTLLQSTSLSGPWITNNSAASPYTIAPTNSRMFFRVLAN